MNIFNKFYRNFTLEKDANIIVIDNGDGEIVAYAMKWRNGKIVKFSSGSNYRSLHLNKRMEDIRKLATILVSGNGDINHQHAVLYAMKQCNEGKPAEKYFTHYKRLPSQSGVRYTKSDGTIDSEIQYADLMAASFNIILEGIFYGINYSQNIDNLLDPNLPTYIFVGRPSSGKWNSEEIQYQQLLTSKMHDYICEVEETQTEVSYHKNNIKVFLVSEADAAFAQLVCRERDGKPLPEHEYVIMIDVGSSTVDITVVRGNEVILKDSRTIGGGDLDKCLLNCIKEKIGVNNLDEWVLFTTRDKKEKYFGPNGIEPQIIRINGCKVDIDEEIMEKAISHTEIFSRDEEKAYPSWEACIVAFYKDVKKRMIGKLTEEDNPLPSKILVTGGVSNMPCVLDWATKVFGTKAERPLKTLPSDSVALGLSYIAEKELQIEVFRQHIVDEVNRLLDSSSESFAGCMAYGLGEYLFNDAVCPTMNKWYWGHYKNVDSLEDYCNALGVYTRREVGPFGENEGPGVRKGIENGLEKWVNEQQMELKIQNSITTKFKEIFPKSEYKFDKKFKIKDVVKRYRSSIGEITYWYSNEILKEILSKDYTYCYGMKAPKYASEQVVEREGIFGLFRVEHTLYSIKDIREKVCSNRERIIHGLSSVNRFNQDNNAEFRQSCNEILSDLRKQLMESLENYIDQLTPYKLL